MDEFTSEELAAWIDQKFEYELQPGELTAAIYARVSNIDKQAASYRLNKMVKAGQMASKYETMAGKHTRIFYRLNGGAE